MTTPTDPTWRRSNPPLPNPGGDGGGGNQPGAALPETGSVLGEEARQAILAAIQAADGPGSNYPRLMWKLEPVVAALVAAARDESAAQVWSRYARQYEHAEKMPRWDQDKGVVANGWAAGRCGNCGEELPSNDEAAPPRSRS